MIAVTRCYSFAASHRLHLHSFSEQQNEELYGKCNNPFGHGHNYRLEVGVVGTVDQLTGQLLPLSLLDQLVRESVLDCVDHRYLNLDVPEFGDLVPTTENVLNVIARLLQQQWHSHIPQQVQLYRLHLQETDRNGFEAFFPLNSSAPMPASARRESGSSLQ